MSTVTLQVFESLVTSVRHLASDDSYKVLEGVIDEIPSMKAQIASKSKETDDLKTEISSLKLRHENRIQEDLELYRLQQNKLEEARSKQSEDISALKETIQEKDITITGLKKAGNDIQSRLTQVKQSWNEEKQKLAIANKEITTLQQNLKMKDVEIDKMRDALRSEKAEVSRAGGQLKAVQNENSSLQQKLKSNTERLSELEGFATPLHDEDEQKWIDELDGMWKSARRLVESHFNADLPQKILEDPDPWKRVREFKQLDSSIPLPQSNSPAAKNMRIAAVLAIIARCIDNSIFQPTYITDEVDVIRGLLLRLAGKNSKQESFCRAILLSIFPEEQKKNATRAIRTVVTEVSPYIQELLPISQYESFRLGLEKVAKQAVEIWPTVQRASEKFEPNFDLQHSEEGEWQTLTFSNVKSTTSKEDSTKSSDGDKKLLVIFPRVYSIDDDDDDPYPVTDGLVLMKSQVAAAATEEMEKRNPPSPTAGRTVPSRNRSNRSRTKSVSVNSGTDFLQQTPSGVQ